MRSRKRGFSTASGSRAIVIAIGGTACSWMAPNIAPANILLPRHAQPRVPKTGRGAAHLALTRNHQQAQELRDFPTTRHAAGYGQGPRRGASLKSRAPGTNLTIKPAEQPRQDKAATPSTAGGIAPSPAPMRSPPASQQYLVDARLNRRVVGAQPALALLAVPVLAANDRLRQRLDVRTASAGRCTANA